MSDANTVPGTPGKDGEPDTGIPTDAPPTTEGTPVERDDAADDPNTLPDSLGDEGAPYV